MITDTAAQEGLTSMVLHPNTMYFELARVPTADDGKDLHLYLGSRQHAECTPCPRNIVLVWM